jgi:hypothetical protein
MTRIGFGLVIAMLAWIAAPPARAETIALSAMGFVTHCPCPVGGSFAEEEQAGTLKTIQANSRFFMPVSFPNGVKVCSLSLVYRDVNANDPIRARLLRKTYATGSNPFSAPITMASVTSASGVVDAVRIATTKTINQAGIGNANSFYYVLVESATFNLDFLGVKIETRPTSQTCP